MTTKDTPIHYHLESHKNVRSLVSETRDWEHKYMSSVWLSALYIKCITHKGMPMQANQCYGYQDESVSAP